MNEQLRKIANQAQWAEEWFPLGSLLRQTCDYIAGLEERLEKLEQAAARTADEWQAIAEARCEKEITQ